MSLELSCDRGKSMHAFMGKLFPINRSITGDGLRKSLKLFQERIPGLEIHAMSSGTKCFDWTIPEEWNIQGGHIIGPAGEKVVDFEDSNLHVMGYSTPVDRKISKEELEEHLYSLPEQPDAIPYVTSYYKRDWGFCLKHSTREALPEGEYQVKIDSTLEPGHLNYGELLIPATAETDQEVFISSYACHPSMANNELSGPIVASELARWLLESDERRFNYRFVIIPETIGSIAYISQNLNALKKNVVAGFNLTCIGDEREYSYLPTRQEDTLSDRTAMHALSHHAEDYLKYSFSERGSDERQYNSPGVDLPVASIMRSKYWTYPEYHTSLDDMTLVTPNGLQGGFEAVQKTILSLESNRLYRATCLCEPQLGRRGLYPETSEKAGYQSVENMMDLLMYSDGQHDLLWIADKINVPVWELSPIARNLAKHHLLEEVKE